jgi:hypothetical protein
MEFDMNRLFGFLLAALAWFTVTSAWAAADEGAFIEAVLSDTEVNHLVFMREEEKLARDTYITLNNTWGLMVFSNIASAEQTHMNTMQWMLDIYGVDDPVVDDTIGSFTNVTLAGLYNELVANGKVSLLDALFIGALIEEIDMRDIQQAIDETVHVDIIIAYENLMAGSENHLRAFVSQIERLGVEYVAQVLDQAEVDAILGKSNPVQFEINAGLNDAWYYPATSGQGFFITVFPDLELVALAWFTYDTERPAGDVEAILGDAGHRWLTATGPYSGSEAQLEISITTGGIFDSSVPAPVSDPGGSVLLHFDGCNSGTVSYEIPSINRTGVVPIERVALDNVALCEAIIGVAD